MINRITADEARRLNSFDQQMDVCYQKIRSSAEEGFNHTIMDESYSKMWSDGAYDQSEDFLRAKQMLTQDGFVVRMQMNTGSAAYSIKTIISW